MKSCHFLQTKRAAEMDLMFNAFNMLRKICWKPGLVTIISILLKNLQGKQKTGFERLSEKESCGSTNLWNQDEKLYTMKVLYETLQKIDAP